MERNINTKFQQQFTNHTQSRLDVQDRQNKFCLDENIMMLINILDERDQQEQCSSLYVTINHQIKLENETTIRQILSHLQQSEREFQNQNFQQSKIILFKIFQSQNPLDLQKITDQISQSNDFCDDIQGQEIVMFIGFTGTGKSTLIHYLAGSKIEKTTTEDGLMHWEPINQPSYKNMDLVVSKADAKSETKFVIPIQIRTKDQQGNEYGEDDTYILTDSPGFQDTDGKESEIANLTAITKSIQACQSIKLVVVISEKQISDKGQGIKSIANVIKKMVKPSQSFQQVVDKFQFIFTKYDKEDDRKQLHIKLKNIQKNLNLQEQKDKEFVSVLNCMIKKTIVQKNIAFFDLTLKGYEFLELYIKNVKPITNPKDFFTCFLTQEAECFMGQQIKNDQSRIQTALNNKNYILIYKKMKQLQVLRDNIQDLELINNQWKQNDDLIDKYINSQIKNVEEFIQQMINSKEIQKEQITNFLNTKQQSNQIKILQEFIPQAENLIKKFDGALEKVNLSILEEAKMEQVSLQQNNLNGHYKKLLVLSQEFPNGTNHIENFQNIVKEIIKKQLENTKNYLKEDNFLKFFDEIQVIMFSIQNLEFIKVCNFQKEIQDILNEIIKKINKLRWDFLEALVEKNSQDQKQRIEDYHKQAKKIMEDFKKSKLNDEQFKTQLNECWEQYNKELKYQFDIREKRVSDIINRESSEFQGIQQKIQLLSLMSKLTDELKKSFEVLINRLNEKVNKICLEIKQQIQQLAVVRGQDLDHKFESLQDILQIINNCEWIQDYDQELEFKFKKEEILKQLRKYASQILGKLGQSEISFDNTEDLEKIDDYSQKINKLKEFQYQDEEIKKTIEKYQEEVDEKFKPYILSIESFIKEELDVYWKFEKYFLFLEQCNKYKTFKSKIQILKETMRDSIKISTDKKEKDLKILINSLRKIFELSSLSKEDRDKVEKYSKQIYERFDDIVKIERYNTIKDLLKERRSEYLIEFQQSHLKKIQLILNEGIQQSIHVEQKWIFILQHLKQIDELEYNSQQLSKFSDLLSKSFEKNKTNVINLKNGLEKKLNSNCLPQILATYKQLKESAEQNQQNQETLLILNDLQFQIENQIRQTLTQVQQYIDKLKQIITYSPISSQFKDLIENSHQIVILFKLYGDYQSHFKEYLDLQQFNTSSEQIVQDIQYIIKEGPKKVQNSFKNNNFKESFDQYNFMIKIFKVLQQKFEIGQQLDLLTKTHDECFNTLKQKVENLKLDNPRTETFDLQFICGRLEAVDDELHRNFSKLLKDIYLDKLEKKLKEAFGKPIDQQEQIIGQVEQYLNQVPKEIKTLLEQLIDKTKNSSQTKYEIDDLINQKDILGLKKIQETLKNTGQFKPFCEKFKKLVQTESEENFQYIVNNLKQYTNIEKNILNLMKVASQSPKELQKLPTEKLNQILNQFFLDQVKQAQNKIQSILNKSNNQISLDFQHYCNLNRSLLYAKSKMDVNELVILKNTIESFFIIDQIEDQKLQVKKHLETRLKQIEANQEDFQYMKDSFIIIIQLQHFDTNAYICLTEIYDRSQVYLKNKLELVINQDITQFKIQKQYEQYYENCQIVLKNAEQMQDLAKQINQNSHSKSLLDNLLYKFSNIVQLLTQTLEKSLSEDIFDDNVVSSINNVYLNSKYMGIYLTRLKNTLDQSTVEQKFKQKIRALFKEPSNTGSASELKETVQYLSNLNRLSNTYIYMEKVRVECDECINQALQKYKDSKGSLEKLQIQLKQSSKYGDQITYNHPFFKGFQISAANSKLQKLDMKIVLDKMKGYFGPDKIEDLNKKQIEDYNQQFQKKYDEYLTKYLTFYDKIDFIDLSKEIQKSVKIIEFQQNGIIEQTSLGVVPELLAGIFACWTCLNSKYYFESKNQSYDNQESFLLKPTPAQLATIFRLLGIGYSTKYDKMQPNNLAQVLTGEGKSVLLAALSSFYALCGFSVKCACYSNQLSARDYEDFSPLFEKLKLKDLIFYGTFNKVCEQILNDRGDIREQISNFIQQGKIQFKDPSTLNKQVLLIDEVDVFFSKEFFGNNYDMVAPIQDETIESLLDKIWSEKLQPNFSFKSISESDQYKKCIAKFPKWSELIQEQVKMAIRDFKSFNNVIVQTYKIQNDKIYYKNQDQYVDNISFGYRTLYSYYQEMENNKISEAGLKIQKMFKINCGSFSYSELPKKFLMIKGVTGTLETLSKSQLELIQKSYNINQYTLVPSVYGDSKFTFNQQKDVKVVSQQEYFNNITNEINKNMIGKRPEQNRTVLVFFSTKEKLAEYHDSEQFKTLRLNFKIQIMTEENTIEERKKIIEDATYSGTITLMTRIFCRGIDFRVIDTTLFQNYGIHVIQTFFSEDKAEETQAKGRTARQGEEGSYSMILEIDTLQAFIKSEEEKNKMTQNGLCYNIIDSNRQANFESHFKSNMKYNQETSITSHNQSEAFLNLLKSCNQVEVKKYLLQLNLGPKENKPSKTLIALDATGSMSGLITQAKNTIQTTFQQARDILQQKGYDPQCFLVMICFFRSYNSKWDEIFQSSSWENNADKLRSFLQTIQAQGGTDPGEAVEVSLWWANKQNDESPINQVIVLGDQPANLESEAQQHRNYFGQSYWNTTPIKQLTYYVPECNKLKSKNIPVHAFYLSNYAKNIYQDISNITGGQSAYLDINSAQSSKQLTNVLVEQILRDVGKQDGLSDELVKAYKAKYS